VLKGGIQLSVSSYRRLIICTHAKLGGFEFSTRSLALKNAENKKKNEKQNGKLKINVFYSIGLGVSMGVAVLAGSFMSLPKAHASEVNWSEDIQNAKKVLAEVAPAVAKVETTDNNTSLPVKLVAENFIQKPLVVETEITPEEKIVKPAQTVAQPAATVNAVAKPQTVVKPKVAVKPATQTKVIAAQGNHFPRGYCTFYVASKRNISWSGNAGTWLSGAKSAGFATGSVPKPGSIMVTSESPVGHVAYVESVNGDEVVVSEMNYRGFGVVSSRTIPIGSGFIKGYIY